MPRGLNQNNYHFKADYVPDLLEPTVKKEKYFKTMEEVSQFFKVSRSTLYNYIRENYPPNRAEKRLTGIVRLEEPLPVYKKILVHFD